MTKKILLLIAFLLLSSLNAEAVTQWCDDVNIIMCLPYDGVNEAAGLLDVSSNNNDATNNSATFTTTNCQKEDCFTYDFNDSLTYGDIAQVDNATVLTGVAWVYHSSLAADDNIIEKFDGDGFVLFRDDSSSVSARTEIYSIFVADSADSSNTRLESPTNGSTLETLTHLAFSFDNLSATGLRLYIDGTEVADSPVSTSAITAIDASAALVTTSGANPHYGTIDEVALFEEVKSSFDINDMKDNFLVQEAAASTFVPKVMMF